MKLSAAQRYMLEELSDCDAAVPDVSMLVTFGPSWKRTASVLERAGLIVNGGAHRGSWRITVDGQRAVAVPTTGGSK